MGFAPAFAAFDVLQFQWPEVARSRAVPTRPSEISASSSDEPPMSQTNPYDPGHPKRTPWADSRASSSPSITQMRKPVSRATSAQKSGPSLASRTAAVATTVSSLKAHPVCKVFETAQCGQGPNAPLWVQNAALGQARAQGTHDFFVVEIGWTACRAVKYDQPDRVGPDIDNAHAGQFACAWIIKQGAAKKARVGMCRLLSVAHEIPDCRFGSLCTNLLVRVNLRRASAWVHLMRQQSLARTGTDFP